MTAALEQRRDALIKANAIRSARARWRRELKGLEGTSPPGYVALRALGASAHDPAGPMCNEIPAELAGVRAIDFLTWLRSARRAIIHRWLRTLAISDNRTLASLSDRQREGLGLLLRTEGQEKWWRI
jgi:hypothetical protein